MADSAFNFGGVPPTSAIATKTANYTMTANDVTILADGSGGGFTVTLPAAATVAGRVLRIIKIDVDPTKPIVVATQNSELINGAAPIGAVTLPGTAVNYVSDGTGWKRASVYLPGLNTKFFGGTATKTVSNTTTRTSLTPTGSGSLNRGANFLTVGRSVRLTAGGYFSIASVSTMNFFLSIINNTTSATATIASSSMGSGLGAITGVGWRMSVDLVCTATGTSGSIVATGSLNLNGTVFNIFSTSGTTVDTTQPLTLDPQVQFSAANAGNTITTQILLAETAS